MRDSPIACVARTKSRSTISSAEPRTTRAVRGIVVRPIVSTSSERLGPTVAAATSVSTICGNERMTSIAHQDVVEAAPGVRGDEPDRDPEPDAERGRERRQREHRAAAPEEAAQHVLAQVVGAEHRVRRGSVGDPDQVRRLRRREVRADQREQQQRHEQGQPDLHAPHPERAGDDLAHRAGAATSRHDGDAGDLDLGRAHLSDVRTRGLTSNVTTSASRLTST